MYEKVLLPRCQDSSQINLTAIAPQASRTDKLTYQRLLLTMAHRFEIVDEKVSRSQYSPAKILFSLFKILLF
jgi:hypothetical protein